MRLENDCKKSTEYRYRYARRDICDTNAPDIETAILIRPIPRAAVPQRPLRVIKSPKPYLLDLGTVLKQNCNLEILIGRLWGRGSLGKEKAICP